MNNTVMVQWHPVSEWPELPDGQRSCRVLLTVRYDESDYWEGESKISYDVVTGDYYGDGDFDPDWFYNRNEVAAWAMVEPGMVEGDESEWGRIELRSAI